MVNPVNLSGRSGVSGVSKGDLLRGKSSSYLVEDFLGEGYFGMVARCIKTATDEKVALKIITEQNWEEATYEIRILKRLRVLDPDVCGIVRWMGAFKHGPHLCLEFELLHKSLRDYIRQTAHRPLPLVQIKSILEQVATALDHLGSIGIIHADLKPENIMLTGQDFKVKLIDFGLSLPVGEIGVDFYVVTRWYRAPEIMLGLPFNGSIDMWALGCVAAELLIGFPLYPGSMEYDMWRQILNTHGELPDAMLDHGIRAHLYFTKGSGVWRLKSQQEYRREEEREETRQLRFSSLEEVVQAGNVPGQPIPSSFTDLLKRMLQVDAKQRITPLALLEHPFISPEPSVDHPNSPELSVDHPNTPEPSVDHPNSPEPSRSGVSGVSKGDLLRGKSSSYLVEDFLGEGHFGMVARCIKTATDEKVALKIITEQNWVDATYEILTLKRLRVLDPDVCGIVRWMGAFKHGPHLCLEFELLHKSLRDYIRQTAHRTLPLMQIKSILEQVATALDHLGSIGIIHADLKPENIMLTGQDFKVKLIDFGLSLPVGEIGVDFYVVTRWYRAPEIMLGLPFNGSIDMWALGCVAAELLIGFPLYPGSMEYDMWRQILNTHGELPDAMLDHGIKAHLCFTKGSGVWRLKSQQEYRREEEREETRQLRFSSLEEVVQAGNVPGQPIPPSFTDLLKRMLQVDAKQRITPLALLEHPFISPEPSVDHPNSPELSVDHPNSPEPSVDKPNRCSHWKLSPPVTATVDITDSGKGTSSTPSAVEVQPAVADVQLEVTQKNKKKQSRLKRIFNTVLKKKEIKLSPPVTATVDITDSGKGTSSTPSAVEVQPAVADVQLEVTQKNKKKQSRLRRIFKTVRKTICCCCCLAPDVLD